MAGVLASYLPVDIYLAVIYGLGRFGFLSDALIPFLQAGFILAHVFQLVMLAATLTHSRGIGWEKSLPAALLISYLSLLVVYYGGF